MSQKNFLWLFKISELLFFESGLNENILFIFVFELDDDEIGIALDADGSVSIFNVELLRLLEFDNAIVFFSSVDSSPECTLK